MSDPRFVNIGEFDDKLIEECSELIKAICKAKRFGFDGYHPDRPDKNNAQEILDEIEDVRRAINELEPYLICLVRAK